MLRGDPSDGLPGLKGVGAVAAASMIREHGGIPALLAAKRLSAENSDYLTRAMQVVPPVVDLPIELPRGNRRHYPDDPESLNALMAEHGLQAAASRLVEALNDQVREA
jgi:5'-3' exonuclease